MKARCLVLGASGLLGYPTLLEARKRWGSGAGDGVHGTYRTLPPALADFGCLHRLELSDRPAVEALLDRLRPEIVINCAGVVKAMCDEPYSAITLNAATPHLLAKLLQPWGGRLLHVSTDCVFSGRRGGYSETDVADPADLYGQTKLLGEVTSAPHLTVRTSFIGFELASSRGLLAWFLDQAGPLQGFRKALWSGLTADRLATILVELAARPEVIGLLHVSGESIDKDSLLRLLAKTFRRSDLVIEGVDEPRIERSLDGSRLRALGIEVPPIPEMVSDLRQWGIEHDLTEEVD